MRQMGLKAREKREYKITTDSKHNYPIAPNLLDRNFQVDAPNQVWVADITYIRTMEGWLYLAIIMDLYSRKIVGWAMSNSLSSSIAIDALQMAIRNLKVLSIILTAVFNMPVILTVDFCNEIILPVR